MNRPRAGEPAGRPAAAPGTWRLGRPTGAELALITVAVLGVSASAPMTALCLAPALGIAFWRNGLGALILLPGARRRLRGVGRRDLGWCLASGVLLAGHFAAWLPSVKLTTVAASTALVCTTPLWCTIALRLTGQPVPRLVWAGLGVGFAGVLLVTGVDVTVSAKAVLGDGLALLGGLLAAGYVLIGAAVRARLSTSVYGVLCYSTAAVVLAAAALLTETPLAGYAVRDWLLILAITVAAQLLGHTIFNRVVASVGPTLVGLAILLEVPGAALLAFILLGQVPPLLVIPGLALIVAGLALVVRAGPTEVEPGPAT